METEVESVGETVKGLVRAKRLTLGQAEQVERSIMERDGSVVPEGRVTRWTVAQAVAGVANQEGMGIDDARSLRELAHRITIGESK